MTKLTTASDALLADVLVNDEGLILIEVDVPGWNRRSTCTLEATVIVDGHRTCEPSGSYLLHERPNAVHREFHLPAEADMRNVHARIHDGVLTISALVGTGETEPGVHRIEVLPSAWPCHPDAAAI